MNRFMAVVVLIGMGFVGCAMVDPAPQSLVAKNDHQALATW